MKSNMLGFSAVLLLLLVSSSMQDRPVVGSGCLTTSNTKVPLTNLESYTVQQKPLFPVNAVRILTVKGKVICSSPSSLWAIKAMKYLDAKKKPTSIANISSHQSVTTAHVKTSTTNITRLSTQISVQPFGLK